MNASGDKQSIQEKINRVKFWRHRIEFGDGFFTPGWRGRGYFLELPLEENLAGKSILDVGAWDGLFTFEAERRGATDLLATDVWASSEFDEEWWGGIRNADEGFLTVKELLRSNARSMNCSVYDLSPEVIGKRYDIVLMIAVLYHLPDLFTALCRLAGVTREYAIVESLCDPDLPDDTALMRYDHSQPGLWWRPNALCLRNMLLDAGFSRVELTESRHEELQWEAVTLADIADETPIFDSVGDGAVRIRNLFAGDEVMVMGTEADYAPDEHASFNRVETTDVRRIQGWVPKNKVRPRRKGTVPQVGKRTRIIAKAFV